MEFTLRRWIQRHDDFCSRYRSLKINHPQSPTCLTLYTTSSHQQTPLSTFLWIMVRHKTLILIGKMGTCIFL
jgi:hypothetical protein